MSHDSLLAHCVTFLHRAVVLKLASIVVLMITLYVAVEESCTKEPETCCQQVMGFPCSFQQFVRRARFYM